MGKGKAFPVPPAQREGMEVKPRSAMLEKGRAFPVLHVPRESAGEAGQAPSWERAAPAPGAVGGRGAMAAAAAMAALGRRLTAALRLPRARPGLPGYAPRRADSGSGTEGRARFSRGRRAYGGRRVSVRPGGRVSRLRQPEGCSAVRVRAAPSGSLGLQNPAGIVLLRSVLCRVSAAFA